MAKKQGIRVDVQHILLSSVGEAVLAVDVLVATVLKTLTTIKKDDRRYRSAYYIHNAVAALQKKGLLLLAGKGVGECVSLTDKGVRELARYIQEQETMKPQQWDGKWRMVIFDIKETKKAKRDRIRRNLVRFGFEKLQNSIWVYPYECEDVITFLKADCKIDKEMLYIVSEKIPNDGWIRKKFGLLI